MRQMFAAALGLLAIGAAPLKAQPAVEDVTMAVPAVGFPFTAGYIADGLGLWEKHGLRVKTVLIAGIGSTRVRPDRCRNEDSRHR